MHNHKAVFSFLFSFLLLVLLQPASSSTAHSSLSTDYCPLSTARSSLPTDLLLSADFEGGLPAGWQVSGTPGWVFDDPGGRTNQTGGSGKFAIADSDKAGEVLMNTILQTPELDLSSYTSVKLKFKTYFSANEPSVADVDVSKDGGATWKNVWRQSSADFQGAVSVDLSALTANQAEVKIRFHYYQATYAWYWQVDDVQVEALAALSAPSGLSATASGYNIALKWSDNSSGETGFKVERSPDGATGWAVVASLAANSTAYTDKNLNCNTPYSYRVRAFNAGSTSDYSNTASDRTAACAASTVINETFNAAVLPAGWGVQKNQGGPAKNYTLIGVFFPGGGGWQKTPGGGGGGFQ